MRPKFNTPATNQTHKIHKHTAQDVPVGSYLKMESQPIDVTVLTTLPALTYVRPSASATEPAAPFAM